MSSRMTASSLLATYLSGEGPGDHERAIDDCERQRGETTRRRAEHDLCGTARVKFGSSVGAVAGNEGTELGSTIDIPHAPQDGAFRSPGPKRFHQIYSA